MEYDVVKKVQSAGMILGALGVIGFIGIVWLMIYGNLSGNLGFGQDSTSFNNETITMDGTYQIPSTASGRTNPSLSSVIVTNTTCIHDALDDLGCVIHANNYTISGASINVSLTSEFLSAISFDWNVSATISYDEAGKVNTDNVISNLTGGFTTFFGFSGTLFTIAAIVLLIFMLLGLLAIVMSIVKMQGGKGKFSGH